MLLVAPKKGTKFKTHPTWMCFMLGVCVKGDQTQKHPHWVFSSSKKGTEHKNTPPLVYFCPQYVLSTKPPMLGGLCA